MWGLFDASVLTLGLVNIGRYINRPFFTGMPNCEALLKADQTRYGHVVIFRIFRFLRILRILRFCCGDNSQIVQRIRDNSIFVAHETAAALVALALGGAGGRLYWVTLGRRGPTCFQMWFPNVSHVVSDVVSN